MRFGRRKRCNLFSRYILMNSTEGTCSGKTPLKRQTPAEDECLHGTSTKSPELNTLFKVFDKDNQPSDEEYMNNFVLSLVRRPCSKPLIQPIVEQNVFHFLVKEYPPPKISGLTEDNVLYAVNRLYNILVLQKVDTTLSPEVIKGYKQTINSMEATDSMGNLVPVIDFRSFVDGKTVLETIECSQFKDSDKFKKVKEIIESIKSVEPKTSSENLSREENIKSMIQMLEKKEKLNGVLSNVGYEQLEQLRGELKSYEYAEEIPTTGKFQFKPKSSGGGRERQKSCKRSSRFLKRRGKKTIRKGKSRRRP